MSIRKGSSIIAGNIGQNVDSALSPTSDNPVKNSVLTEAFANTVSAKNITNCITEIPQDIKLELSGTTLTLKAGSKFYYPNGLDGSTLVFDSFTTTIDLALNVGGSGWTAEPHFITVLNDGTASLGYATQDVYSGPNSPTSMSSQYGLWYDTANNIIRRTTDTGTTWTSTPYSFPICIAENTGGTCSGIIQIFNGCGYIGDRGFALPGIKGLIPNGRNSDGSCINTSFETNEVLILQSDPSEVITVTRQHMYFTTNGSQLANSSILEYDVETNYLRLQTTKEIYPLCIIGSFSRTNGTISNFRRRDIIQVTDYNNTEHIAHQSMPSKHYVSLTVGATGTSYTAPTDGWIYVETASSTANQGWVSVNVNSLAYTSGLDIDRTGIGKVFIPIQGKTTFTITYGGTTISKLRFFYAAGVL